MSPRMLLRCPFLLVVCPHTNSMSPAKQLTSQASNWHSQTLHGHDRTVKSGLPIHLYQCRTSISRNQLVTRSRNAEMYTRASTNIPICNFPPSDYLPHLSYIACSLKPPRLGTISGCHCARNVIAVQYPVSFVQLLVQFIGRITYPT
jgi:hypothetical protein